MTFKDRILDYYNISEEEYNYLTRPLDDIKLPSCDNFKGMDKAKAIIEETMAKKEKIVIYGDYDCDGIMATSILYNCFLKLHYEVGYYIPSRYIDGYGLNEKRVREMKEKGYSLIITVDNGIAQFDAIKVAKELGMKVIVTDHHEAKEELPSCDVILHPIISNYGDVYCCGAYVSYMLATSLLGEDDKYLLSLASIATISDLMELRGYNRDIVRLGLKYLNEENFTPIRLLTKDKVITEKTIGMELAPKINAIGRVIKDTRINILIKYFSNSVNNIHQVHEFIEQTNSRRKDITSEVFENLQDMSKEQAIVINLNVDEGLIGLVANKLLNEYRCPTVVFTEDCNDSTILKGSARSKNGLALNLAFESLKDLLIVYGGHELAGGLSIKKDNFDEFKNRFLSYASTHPFVENEPKTMTISLLDINEENCSIIESLSPFGNGFPAPTFKISRIKSNEIKYSKDGRHIMTYIGLKQKIVGFNISHTAFEGSEFASLIGTMSKNYFNGTTTVEFRVEQVATLDRVEI